jgi:sugar/nucleoside kinase (ribokinase family)
VISPYGPDEISRAILEAARHRGIRIARLTVQADDHTRTWTIRAADPSGEVRRATFPFASTRGIYSPAEIAERFTSDTWPFA